MKHSPLQPYSYEHINMMYNFQSELVMQYSAVEILWDRRLMTLIKNYMQTAAAQEVHFPAQTFIIYSQLARSSAQERSH